jgi:hypothetical protein
VLFVTGNPNLVGRARALAGQSSAASGTLFQPQEVKDNINVAYEHLWNLAKEVNQGWGVATDYLTTVADQVYYTLPTDLEGRIISIELEADGKNLSTDTTASPGILKPSSQDVALLGYRTGTITEMKYYWFEYSQTDGKRLGIAAPPTKAGTNSIRIVFEEDLTHLSADGDTPLIPTTHHELIAIQAAMALRISKDMDFQDLRFLEAPRMEMFLSRMSDTVNDDDFSMTVAGRPNRTYAISTGFVNREP